METKKLISILCCILVILFFSLGGFDLFKTGNAKLEKIVSEIQAACPTSIGDGITMLSAEQKDGMVEFGASVSNPDVIQFLLNEENSKERVRLSLLSNEKLLNTLADAKVGITYKYLLVGKDSTAVVSLSADEVVALENGPKISPIELARRMLAQSLETENKTFPTIIEEGLTLTLGTIADGELVYLIIADEALIDMDAMINNKRELKQSLYNILDFTNAQTQQNMQNLVNAEYKLVYKFTGNKTKKSLKIVFTVDEVKNYLENQKK